MTTETETELQARLRKIKNELYEIRCDIPGSFTGPNGREKEAIYALEIQGRRVAEKKNSLSS
jgi:hypothetical protein